MNKTMPFNYPYGKRGSGRTQWMIDQIVDAVKDGQPRCLVVGQNMGQSLDQLMPRIAKALKSAGLKVQAYRERLEVEKSTVLFTSREFVDQKRLGMRAGEFWDHWAEEK